MSAVSSIFHVVINTYRRQMTITDETSDHLYSYIWSIVKGRSCRLYRINGYNDRKTACVNTEISKSQIALFCTFQLWGIFISSCVTNTYNSLKHFHML